MGLCGPTGASLCLIKPHTNVSDTVQNIFLRQQLYVMRPLFATGSLACALISAFGSIFLAVMAILLANDYPCVHVLTVWTHAVCARAAVRTMMPLLHPCSGLAAYITCTWFFHGRFLGEWYSREEPYPEQRDKAVHGAWLICAVYGVLAIVCSVIFSYHSFRCSTCQTQICMHSCCCL